MEDKTVIIVKQGNKIRYVKAQDVIYIESIGRKALLHLTDEVIEYYAKISRLEEQLVPYFFRSHRAYLINLAYVENYSKREIRMKNTDSVLISKYRFSEFEKVLENACKNTAKGLKCSKYRE